METYIIICAIPLIWSRIPTKDIAPILYELLESQEITQYFTELVNREIKKELSPAV